MGAGSEASGPSPRPSYPFEVTSTATEPTKALPPRRAAFVREYLVDLNASRAARDVGYAPKSASVEGSRLLANVEVQAEITRQWAILMEQSNVTPEKIVAELAAIAFADLGDYVRIVRGEPVLDMSEMSTGATLALVGRQQKWDRLAFGTRCLLPVLEWDPRRFGSCFLAFGEFVRCPIQPYPDRIVFRFGPSQRLARALERPGQRSIS